MHVYAHVCTCMEPMKGHESCSYSFRPTGDPKDVESVDEAGANFAAASLPQIWESL